MVGTPRASVTTRVLAILGAFDEQRPRLTLTEIATAAEGGVAGYDVVSWNALFAPAGTPPDIVKILNDALHDVLAEPEVKTRLLELGIEARASTPEEIAARLKSDIDKWRLVIEKSGIERQ